MEGDVTSGLKGAVPSVRLTEIYLNVLRGANLKQIRAWMARVSDLINPQKCGFFLDTKRPGI